MLPFSGIYHGHGVHSNLHLWMEGVRQTFYGVVSFMRIAPSIAIFRSVHGD